MLIFLWIVDHFVESRFLFKNKNSFRTESLLPILLAQVARYKMEILIFPNILFYFLIHTFTLPYTIILFPRSETQKTILS